MNDLHLLHTAVGDCFYLHILVDPEREMRKAVKDSLLMENAVKRMMTGEVSPEELLEMVEPIVGDVDNFVEEVEENLGDIGLM